MEDLPMDETIEVDSDRWISLVYERRWPKNVVQWSIRQRVGDSDFPVQRGEVDGVLRPKDDAQALWDSLRSQALDQANAAVASAVPEQKESRSLLDRIFGRNR